MPKPARVAGPQFAVTSHEQMRHHAFVEEEKQQPKRRWPLGNGGTGRPGPGRPPGSRNVKVRPLDPGYFAEAKRREASGERIDWSREIALAVLEQSDPELVARAMARRIMRGRSSRAVTALLNRGLGKPAR